jgi:transcriptional regulator with XRE-family HTH domain
MENPTRIREVSLLRPLTSLISGYGVGMRDASPGSTAFATLLKEARKARGVGPLEVINATSVNKSTYFRWEAGEVASPNLLQVREVCLFLRIPPTLAGIALGLLTPEDLAADPVLVEIGTVLAGPLPAASRTALRRALEDAPVIVQICQTMATTMAPNARAAMARALDGALSMWQAAIAMEPPREPSGAELVRRARTAR